MPWATFGGQIHEPFLCNHQIGQTEQAVQLRPVLGQTLVAGLLVMEQVLDHMERMLYPSANLGSLRVSS